MLQGFVPSGLLLEDDGATWLGKGVHEGVDLALILK